MTAMATIADRDGADESDVKSEDKIHGPGAERSGECIVGNATSILTTTTKTTMTTIVDRGGSDESELKCKTKTKYIINTILARGRERWERCRGKCGGNADDDTDNDGDV